ncbi:MULTISPECIES: Rpn family recombination-promoting nuclease/putative transposase [Microcoleaceae]|uniref:Rpn family recombination-promoting nuclease/putative transposase n=1 Tax=Microcoleaceae TaxID=1892252 RepID=UPI00187F6C48|nr:Rpn family recombination-promoting nuclease/putative transposase [Tychonema sp. LEGE 06208]MBE9163431.1 Rpn family recombination-promoting nuclease/putative transposase [Tychonema sp. LEGE 06208]
MRRDSIFYKLFQEAPTLLFELLEESPSNAEQYRFDSVAVKEPKFEIDGVFLPPDAAPGVVYFCEVQFQRDELLYERLFGESFLYFYRNRQRFTDWEAVVIYPSRSTEQSETHPYRSLTCSNQVHRVYLDELGAIEQLPLGVALMALTTIDEASTPEAARLLLARSQREESEAASRAIIEMLTTILVYKFTNLNRREAEAMLGITLEETRFYREAKEEGIEQGIEQGREQGIEQGREQEGRALILRLLNRRLLNRRVGTLPESITSRIADLSIEQIETLAEELLDFQSIADLEIWLENLPQED